MSLVAAMLRQNVSQRDCFLKARVGHPKNPLSKWARGLFQKPCIKKCPFFSLCTLLLVVRKRIDDYERRHSGNTCHPSAERMAKPARAHCKGVQGSESSWWFGKWIGTVSFDPNDLEKLLHDANDHTKETYYLKKRSFAWNI